MVPEWINIIRDYLRYAETKICLKFAARRGTRPGWIQRSYQIILLFITFFPIRTGAGTFIQDAPYINTGMVIVQWYHLADHCFCLGLKIRILHVFKAQSPGMVFLPDQDSLFITQVQKDLVIRTMNSADGICPEMSYHFQIVGRDSLLPSV